MKGSTIDAMSDAIDRAEIMLYTVSLPYKESANCRLEATCEARTPLLAAKLECSLADAGRCLQTRTSSS